MISFLLYLESKILELPIEARDILPSLKKRIMELNNEVMMDYDTIYHELVHAYDPSFRKKISKRKNTPIGQSLLTPHEILAVTSSRLDDIRNKLSSMSSFQRKQAIEELSQWLKSHKNEDDLETHNLPHLLRGLSLFAYKRNPKLWKQFTSRLWHIIDSQKDI